MLLLDDEERFRGGLAGSLRDDGHEVRDFSTPTELPPLATLGDIGVVVTDYEMPGRHGLAFADEFHALHPHVPVVLMTAHWTRAVQAQAAARPFLHLHRKPLDYDEFHKLLHDLASAR